jgi:hypothetical protein
MKILAIDPGPKLSAFVEIDTGTCIPMECGKWQNVLLRELLTQADDYEMVVIEEIIARKWAGREVSDTAFEAGRLAQAAQGPFQLISRSKVRGHWAPGGNDSKVIHALIKRFQPVVYKMYEDEVIKKHGMFQIAKERWFKGFSEDIWQAYAVGTCYIDIMNHDICQ